MMKPDDMQGNIMQNPLSVLIVEDSDNDAVLMVRQLRQAGFEVTYERVETAEKMSASLDRHACDLVLADFSLPNFSAGEALAMVRDSGLDIPFIVVSGVIREEAAIELMRSGAHDYLLKSNLSRLAPAVTREIAEARVRHEHRQAEVQIRRLNTAYATLSQTNEAIVRIASQAELFPRICHIAVNTGGYLGARIGLFDDAGALQSQDYSAGILDAYFQRIDIRTDPALPEGHGPIAIALRENRPVFCDDFLTDPTTAPWHDLAREFGIRASAALPLRRRNFVIGALMLYSAEANTFNAQTCALLEEMAKDISFALENYDREALRRQAEADLRESEQLFRCVVQQNIVAIFMVGSNGRMVFANPRICEILGYAPGELDRREVLQLVAEPDRADVAEMMRKVATGETEAVERNFICLRKDGSLADVGARATRVLLDNKPVLLAVAQDIGERKKAQEEILRHVKQLERSMLATVEAVSAMVEMRDPYTAGHERRVGELAAALGSEMGLPEESVTGLRMTGLVHDIGKISVPAEILSKPGRLSEIEFELIKNHPRSGYDILKGVEFPWPLLEIILQHHERMDGSGYPQHLKGDLIILEARIMAVADVVESMASHRPYRQALGIDKALEEIEQNSGRLYDPLVASACLRLFREKGYKLPQ